MSDSRADVAAVAQRHGLSTGAGQALFDALVAGGGRQAQFSHPELGGMGQWSGGMTQIGDMFNDTLKAKVSAFCHDMAGDAAEARRETHSASQGGRSSSPWAVKDHGGTNGKDGWWPGSLGQPTSSGSQNDMSYACFPDKRRLAVSRGGRVMVYDTGAHQLTGFSQQQPGSGALSFASQHGPVNIDDLKLVDS